MKLSRDIQLSLPVHVPNAIGMAVWANLRRCFLEYDVMVLYSLINTVMRFEIVSATQHNLYVKTV